MTVLSEDLNPHIPNILDKFEVKIKFTKFSTSDWFDYAREAHIQYQRDYDLPTNKLRLKEASLFKQEILKALEKTFVDDENPENTWKYIIVNIRKMICWAWDLPEFLINTQVTIDVDEKCKQMLYSIKFTSQTPIIAGIVRAIQLNFTPKIRKIQNEYT